MGNQPIAVVYLFMLLSEQYDFVTILRERVHRSLFVSYSQMADNKLRTLYVYLLPKTNWTKLSCRIFNTEYLLSALQTMSTLQTMSAWISKSIRDLCGFDNIQAQWSFYCIKRTTEASLCSCSEGCRQTDFFRQRFTLEWINESSVENPSLWSRYAGLARLCFFGIHKVSSIVVWVDCRCTDRPCLLANTRI
jgi:hypothetical protein